jgi:hypothetical protein
VLFLSEGVSCDAPLPVRSYQILNIRFHYILLLWQQLFTTNGGIRIRLISQLDDSWMILILLT